MALRITSRGRKRFIRGLLRTTIGMNRLLDSLVDPKRAVELNLAMIPSPISRVLQQLLRVDIAVIRLWINRLNYEDSRFRATQCRPVRDDHHCPQLPMELFESDCLMDAQEKHLISEEKEVVSTGNPLTSEIHRHTQSKTSSTSSTQYSHS